tara:strand:+ start:515 stop:1003 length:489 start_codon:yes stop_codon:yes gene_type:complete
MNVTFEGNTATGKDEWLTPPYVIQSLGEFDLDPSSPINRPFETAKNYYTILDNGLIKEWQGRVWCNPPYGKHTKAWLKKCKEYGNAIVLIFARTETRMFFDHIWNDADAIFFIKGRLKFYHIDGTQGDAAGAPSVLVAYGDYNAEALKNCSLEGKYIDLRFD